MGRKCDGKKKDDAHRETKSCTFRFASDSSRGQGQRLDKFKHVASVTGIFTHSESLLLVKDEMFSRVHLNVRARVQTPHTPFPNLQKIRWIDRTTSELKYLTAL